MPISVGKKCERNALTTAHFQSWIDWAKSHVRGLDFNPTFFSQSLGQRRLDPFQSGRRDPRLLDRAWDRLPENRRGNGTPARLGHGDECLDSGWFQGGPHRPQGAARTARLVARRPVQGKARPGRPSRRGRIEALRHRLGIVCRRVARILPRLRREKSEALLPRRRPLSSHRNHRGQNLPRC